MLRGALAAAWIAEHGEPSGPRRQEFVDLFESTVRFGPLFAPGSAVVPLSVLRCKYQPDDACAAVWHDEAAEESPGEADPLCPHCQGPMVRGRGEVEFFGGAGLSVRTTRVALGADGVAQHGALYTRDELAHRDLAGTPRRFVGRITDGGQAISDWLMRDRQLLLGGRRSTSGACDYTADPDSEQPPVPAPLNGDHLVLRLLSPAVFVDEAGRPTDRPDSRLLRSLLGVDVSICRVWVRRERVGGWHAAADLPKPDELAVSAGSTYLLRLGGDPGPEAQRTLVEHGLGLRRAEGFGWVELGPWSPPRPEVPVVSGRPDRVVVGMSERLADLPGNLGRWFAAELRRYVAYLAGGGTPHADLLNRRRLESLTPKDRLLIETLLLSADIALISAIVGAIEARVREVL